MKKYDLILFFNLLFLFAVFFACEDDNTAPEKEEYDPSMPVELTSFFPDSGRIREKVILDGENFGSDPEKIRVYFNNKRAAIIGSSGRRMYVMVPRMPGDECDVSVAVGNDSVVYDRQFRYKITVSVSTVAGDGTNAIRTGSLEQSQIAPFQMDVDQNDNIFVGLDNPISDAASYSSAGLVRINEAENIMELVSQFPNTANSRFEGICADKNTGILYTAVRTGTLDYAIIDPVNGWIPRYRTMTFRESTYPIPTANGNYMGYNPADKHMYTRYSTGQIVKIDPDTGQAEIIFQTTDQGTSIGIDVDPKHPNMLYIAGYSSGTVAHGIWRLDINDPEHSWTRLNISKTSGYRDGPIEQALFNTPYGLKFDQDGICYISDLKNQCIRKYDPASGMVETVLGIPGTAGMKDGGKEEAMFNEPSAVGIGMDGTVYVADRTNRRIRKLSIE
jgi:streptogramin lyase